ncbi:MAG: amidohydrolase [Eubacteriales bacterium]|nr:amidohydrolase [Eubacteriales bacterium]
MDYSTPYADIAFKNGCVVTVDDEDEIVRAVAVKGKYICYVGDNEGLRPFIGPYTRVVDLRGRTMTPGFVDCHFHPILYGFFGGAILNITYPICRSIAEIQEVIREKAKTVAKGEWISVFGYDQNKLSDRRHITLDDLDEAAPENPVQCNRACGHLAVYNTLGLAAGGIHTPSDVKKFGPNEVVVENGRLTGLTKDTAHFYLWSKVRYTNAEMLAAVRKSNRLLLQAGVTSIHDPGECGAPSNRIMQKACADGTFKPRAYTMLHTIFGKNPSLKVVDDFLALGLMSGVGDEHFKLGTLKFMIDGGTSGPSCATRAPYSHDSALPGILAWSQPEVDEILARGNAAECQMTAHAVGDLAVEMMVNGYEKAFRINPRPDLRHRIEHSALTDPRLIARMANMNIIPVSNPHFITINGSDYRRYYGGRVDYMFAMRSYLDAGLRPVIGSDAPTADESVLRGLDGAVNRIDRRTGEVCGPKQKISLMEAIRCYTLNGAYASFEDNIKGSVEVGKLADLTVFDRDLLAMPADALMDAAVEMTFIDGEPVFIRDGSLNSIEPIAFQLSRQAQYAPVP